VQLLNSRPTLTRASNGRRRIEAEQSCTHDAEIFSGGQVKHHLLEKTHSHEPDFQLSERLAEAHPLTTAKGQQREPLSALEMAFRTQGIQISGSATADAVRR